MLIAGVGALACIAVIAINLFPPAQLSGTGQFTAYLAGMILGIAFLCAVPLWLTRRTGIYDPPGSRVTSIGAKLHPVVSRPRRAATAPR